ncbi:ABC transporter substrate-binding protein [Actinokineospora inagensis]|uniref:ABC transporter substrate-binding protein n=1 Tax=Actinokineospora inagensis TaxID=103730 RepID=UPI000686FE35|nr:ABC transporter substrate-binding protein [Actinokineospora inagensis]
MNQTRLRASTDLPEPVAAHRHPALAVTRLHARQLFSYRSDPVPGSWQAVAPVPDLAAAVPSIYNGGLGASGRSYVIHLRRGAAWDTASDTTPARPVTAHDVVRGLKRLCTQFYRSTALPYFLTAVRGMADYRDGHPASMRTAADLADHANTHDIDGVFALDDHTVVVEVTHPAADIIDLLALPCASPAPVEYDAFLPESPETRRNLRSNGPYRPTGISGTGVVLEPNPAWVPASDPIRSRHLDRITITSDQADQAGQADLDLRTDDEPRSPLLGLEYLALNTRGRLRDRAARLAVAAATSRSARSIIPPGNEGHQDQADEPVSTPLPLPVPLTLAHLDSPDARTTALSVAADLITVGLTVHLRPLTHAEHAALLTDCGKAEAGEWDILVNTWFPDWAHGNARAFLLPLCHSAHAPGGHDDPRIDELIDTALAEQDTPARSIPALQEAERRALASAMVVPLSYRQPPAPSRPVAVLSALGGVADLSNLRPEPGAEPTPLPAPREISEVSR